MRSILKIISNTIALAIFILLSIYSIIIIKEIKEVKTKELPLKIGYNTIKIYDKNDKEIKENTIKNSYAQLSDISINIQNAFIASEDRDFYKHNGINKKRIAKAILINLKDKGYSVGASTITQQYVKNIYLSNEKTLKRKKKEILYAIEIENRYTKKQILEAYLNSILFGGSIYGIKEATLYYFNKEPNNITINEAAYLAGMIQAPNKYNAFTNLEASDKRKNIVLKSMLEEGYITEKDYQDNINKSISTSLNKQKDENKNHLFQYIDYIYEENKINANEIYTYFDRNIQDELNNIALDKYKLINDDKINLAIVVVDNNTYGLKAILKNRSLNRKTLDEATIVLHQPGSTIKPILDYGPAIEYLDYTPATIIDDEEYTYTNGEKIKNYDNRYLGPITLRYALKDSRNIPALKLYQRLGSKSKDFALSLGLNIDTLYEADSIGGATNGYTILELANAYATLANLGKYKKITPIRYSKINSSIVEDNEHPKQVIKASTAFLLNSILHDVFKNTSYDLKNTYLMAKTGQTNYDEKTRLKYNIPITASKDSLLFAYTKDLTIGIWVGYDKIESNCYLDSPKKAIARNIMKILMNKFAKDNMYFEIPDDIVERKIEIYNGRAYLSNDGYLEYFLKGTEPLTYRNKFEKI